MVSKIKIMASIFMLFGILLISSFVSASVGISRDYHEANYLWVKPGETKVVEIGRLIATAETEDTIVELSILEGGEVASLTEENVLVLAGGKKEINLRVSVPEDAVEGTVYSVRVKAKDVTPLDEKGGMISFTESKTVSIPIRVGTEVIEEPSEETPAEGGLGIWWWVIIIVVLVIVVWIVMKMKKSSVNQMPVKPMKKHK